MKTGLLLLLIMLFLSCSPGKKPPVPLSTGMLKTQLFTLNTETDTAIITRHGSVIRIAAGSFSVQGEINLMIKEAFTPAEILAAGLITESNGRPLRTGGMIYINTVDTGISLLKPIRVSVPNAYYDSAMQIFKGAQTDSGSINWTEPAQPDPETQAENWAYGKRLFQTKCAGCHSLFRDLSGPALANLEDRGPWSAPENIRSYIRNPAAFMTGNRYAQNLRLQYGSMMTAFPALTDSSIDLLLAYIRNETKKPGEIEPDIMNNPIQEGEGKDTSSRTGHADPCRIDTVYIKPSLEVVSVFESDEEVTLANFPDDTIPAQNKNGPETMEGLRSGFTDPNPTNGMYDFEIKTLGWYNVDADIAGYPGTISVKLWVSLQQETESDIQVYLFIPRNKMLSIANSYDNGKLFFNKIDGGIPLFLNDKAILFAFGSHDKHIYYGIKEFRIRAEQTIELTISETDEKTIREALYKEQLDGIDLGIEKKDTRIIRRYCDENLMRADSLAKK